MGWLNKNRAFVCVCIVRLILFQFLFNWSVFPYSRVIPGLVWFPKLFGVVGAWVLQSGRLFSHPSFDQNLKTSFSAIDIWRCWCDMLFTFVVNYADSVTSDLQMEGDYGMLLLLLGWNPRNFCGHISGISRVPVQRSCSNRRWRLSWAAAAGWQLLCTSACQLVWAIHHDGGGSVSEQKYWKVRHWCHWTSSCLTGACHIIAELYTWSWQCVYCAEVFYVLVFWMMKVNLMNNYWHVHCRLLVICFWQASTLKFCIPCL